MDDSRVKTVFSPGNLPILLDGIRAISLLAATEASGSGIDSATVTNAMFLVHDLVYALQDVVDDMSNRLAVLEIGPLGVSAICGEVSHD